VSEANPERSDGFLINNDELKFTADVMNFYTGSVLDDGRIHMWLNGDEKEIFEFIHELHMKIDIDATVFCVTLKEQCLDKDTVSTMQASQYFKRFIMAKFDKFVNDKKEKEN